MYVNDNADFMLPNAPSGGGIVDSESWCGVQQENWGFNPPASIYNTNWPYYNNSIFGQYLTTEYGVYRCPGDLLPSANGIRIRSYSMNGQMGDLYPGVVALAKSGNPHYYNFAKMSTLAGKMAVSDVFVFAEENMCTLDDGWMQMVCGDPSIISQWGYYPNCPSSYHGKVCGFSFFDGHCEDHKWLTADLPGFVATYYYLKENVNGQDGGPSIKLDATGGVGNKDWQWLETHATVPLPGYKMFQ